MLRGPGVETWWWGTRNDGDAIITSGTTTLARNMAYRNLTISNATLKTNSYMIMASEKISLGSNAHIVNVGLPAGSSTGGAGASGGFFFGGTHGGNGTSGEGDGSAGTVPDVAGVLLQAFDNSNPPFTYPGQGGDGGATFTSPHNGGGGGTVNGFNYNNGLYPHVSHPHVWSNGWVMNYLGAMKKFHGGTGGGGGAGTTGSTGGGGGGGGGVIWLAAPVIELTDNTAVIDASGGNGRQGTGTEAGGGGGGGGGLIIMICGKFIDATSGAGLRANGGNGGNGSPLGISGGAGGFGGMVMLIEMTGTPFLYWSNDGNPGG